MDDPLYDPLTQSIPCQFEMKWKGQCMEPSESGWCDTHRQMTCVRCGKQAIRECDFNISGHDLPGGTSFFSCYAKLCENCEHQPYVAGRTIIPACDVHLTFAELEEQKRLALRLNSEWSDNKDENDDWLKAGST
jgi:hypothetical protein